MSAPPPHTGRARSLRAPELCRIRLFAVAACVVLAGCATQNENYALGGPGTDSLMLVGDRSHRDQYLAHVRSDPLGAYLSAQEKVSRPSAPRGLASTALNYLGIKYRFGGNAPDTGFDCSGLVVYAAEKSLGLKLPRRSSEMARLGQSVKRDELERGDLVFFNTRGHRFSHVGIYLGEGKFVHAPSTGSRVRVEDMNIGYWKKRYNGARRLAANGPTHARVSGKSAATQKVASK
ncbi:C40 family peptidase [bacterium SGD-2]|nr:C40 family peptidase [bacterium SGD-2]